MFRPRQLFLTVLVLLATVTWGNSAYIFTKAQLAQILIADAWQKSLVRQTAVKSWYWADTWPVARMRQHRLNIDLFVLSGTDGSSLAFGPGVAHGTDLPGAGGASLIGGHRDTHFRFLQDINEGDKFSFQLADGSWSEYVLVSTEIVDTRDGNSVMLASELDQIFLVTCYPFDAIDPGGPLRFQAILLPE